MSSPDSPIGQGFSPEPEHDVASGTRTLVLGPYLTRKRGGASDRTAPDADNARPFEARLDEATGLAAAIELNVVEAAIAPLATPRPSTYLGKGKVEEIKGLIAAQEIGLVVMDCALSPVQQRNLEKAWGAKVIDRTGLILEIFGRRARTRGGYAPGRTGASGLPEESPRAVLDPP